ncbi:MAG: BamA/TamA family outer membrane protein [Longimonas sp.]|uniref:BamA/TamA family outer membrane protein n=1 Tax=Longimonas sp. TaxID=2039626 RepID=UPI00334DEDD4
MFACGGLPYESAAQQATQRASEATHDSPEDRPLVRRVRIEGNETIRTSRIQQRIQTQANRRILSIPGFTWWRWVYQFGDTIGGRVGDAFRSSGEAPAYLDRSIVQNDVERLQVFYEQQGFREAEIEFEVHETDRDDRVTVHFLIDEGPPTYLRSIEYAGIQGAPESVQAEIINESVFEDAVSADGNPFQLQIEGQRYVTPLLLEERQRVLRALRNGGYAAVSRDSIRALVYTPQPDSFDVEMRVRTGTRYRFGDVRFSVEGPTPEADTRRSSLQVDVDSSAGYTPTVTATIASERRLSEALLQRALQFTPGTYYSQERLLATKRRLEGTGVFTFTNLSPQLAEAHPIPETDEALVPVQIEARTRERHQLRAETFALQREVITDVENELGLGVGLTYENTNLLGGGERFQMRTAASVATNLDSLTSVQLEAAPSLTLPYLIYPFGGLDRWFRLADARTRISLSALTARRDDLRLRIRARIGAQLRLELDHTESLRSLIDVVDLSVSNPDTLDQFSERFLDRVLGTGDQTGITDPVQRTQIIEDYTEPQFNSAMRYTLQSITANPLRRNQGHVYEGSVEVGNLIPLALDWFAFSPGTLSNSVPGLGGQSLLYRPYVRGQVDLRRYIPVGQRSTVALRAFGGAAHPFGIPDVVPFDRRYFSGGGNSVRGWALRELGPGSATLLSPDTAPNMTSDADIANILGGDIKLEANVEFRTRIIRQLLAADWLLTGFVDAGNVWFGPRNPGLAAAPDDEVLKRASGRFRLPEAAQEIGVGSGIGLRLAWEFFIVRLDLAYRVHDPSPLQDDIFRNGFRDPRLHFGIGHAF